VAAFTVTLLAAPALALTVPACALLAAPHCSPNPAHQPPAASAPHSLPSHAAAPDKDLD
jgi:hypothetical protein